MKLDRETILQKGFDLTQFLPLQAVSLLRVASEFGVTAASVRYHLQARDALTAGIINVFYRSLLKDWPSVSGDWKADLSAFAVTVYRKYLTYPGIAAYFAAENRFRILAEAINSQDGDHTVLFLERYFALIRPVGLDPDKGARYAVILLQLLHMTAHATTRHQWPGEHERLSSSLDRLDASRFPNIAALRTSYLQVAGDVAFEAALALVLSGLEQARSKPGPQPCGGSQTPNRSR